MAEIQEWYNVWNAINVTQYLKRLKTENHMIISIDAEKLFEKNSTLIPDKNSQKTSFTKLGWEVPQSDKGNLWRIYS